MEKEKRRVGCRVSRTGLVCRCNNVHLNTITEIVNSCDSNEKKMVQQLTGASTGCGGCENIIDDVIKHKKSQQLEINKIA